MELLAWIENSGFATWVRESPSLLAYTLFLAVHTIGLAFLVGFSVAIMLRFFGVGSRLPLAPMASFFPFMYVGFWMNAVTGLVLLVTAPINFLTNPVFYFKMAAIVGSIVFLRKIRHQVFGDLATVDKKPIPANAKMLAGLSVGLWAVAIVMGRSTAYSRPVVVATIWAFLVFAVLFMAGVFVVRLMNRRDLSSQRA